MSGSFDETLFITLNVLPVNKRKQLVILLEIVWERSNGYA